MMHWSAVGRACVGALVALELTIAAAGAVFEPAAGSPFPAGENPAWAGVGDLDRRRGADLAVVNFGSEDVTVLLGDGAGHLAPAPGSPFSIGAGRGPRSAVLDDFDGDGVVDVATANALSEDVSVLLGDRRGGFAPAAGSPFPAGRGPEAIASGHLDGPEAADLAVVNFSSGDVTVLLGDGRGGFVPAPGSPFSVAPGMGPRSIAVADFDGDRRADLAVANELSADVTVLLGDGRGGFARAPGAPFSVAPGVVVIALAAADLDRDADPDVAAANLVSGDVSVLLGDGAGGLAPAPGSPFSVLPGLGPVAVAVADVDGGGTADLALVNELSSDVSLLRGRAGGFELDGWPSSVLPGVQPVHLAAGDLDSDRRPDLVTANYASGDATVLLNRP